MQERFQAPHRVYLHVPWCRTRCPYCAFALTSLQNRPRSTNFGSQISAELAHWQQQLSLTQPLTSLYLGGGSPSLLTPPELEEIFQHFEIDNDTEVTLEVNPEDVTRDIVETWQRLGINRISLGVQSFAPEIARALGRWRSYQHLDRALGLIARHFDNWSLDLVYGYIGESERDWALSLTRTVRWNPPHISLYALTIEEGTPFRLRSRRGFPLVLSDDQLAERWHQAIEFLAGWELYEVSNLARPGFRAQHNSAYWKGEHWLGLGPGASGTLLTTDGAFYRYTNPHPSGAPSGACLNASEVALEQLALGLRCDTGVPLALFAKRRNLNRLIEDRLGHCDDRRFYLYPAQWYRADGYASFLMEDLITEQEPVPV